MVQDQGASTLPFTLETILKDLDNDPSYKAGQFSGLGPNALLEKTIRDSASATRETAQINQSVFSLVVTVIQADQMNRLALKLEGSFTNFIETLKAENKETSKLTNKLVNWNRWLTILTAILAAATVFMAVATAFMAYEAKLQVDLAARQPVKQFECPPGHP